MEKSKKLISELILPMILCWFLMTLFVDIFTVPAVFRNSRSLEDAGKIGMLIFGKFNGFEMFFGAFILLGSFIKFPSRKLFYFALPLFTLSLIYAFYMTPTIASLTQAIHATGPADPNFALLQSEHARFHGLYRAFDSAKLFALLVFFIVALLDKLNGQNSKERQ